MSAAAWKFADASHRDGVAAVRWARLAASLAQDDEASQRRLIELLAKTGDRAGALRAFDGLARTLAAEFESEPSAETLQLVSRVRAARSRGVDSSPDARPLDGSSQNPLASVPPGRDIPTDDSPRRSRRGSLVAAGALVLIAAAAWSVFGYFHARPSVGTSVAVMPFLDLSPDRRDEYLSDGMAEELSDALSQVPGLRVTARTSAFAFKGRPADARAIGRALGAETLVEGSLRHEGNTLRVTAQLIDARTGYHRWSRTYDRELADVFSVQDDIVQAIVEELAPKLGGAIRSRTTLPRHATTSLSTYTLYLQGRYFWNHLTRPSLERAVALFDSAAAADSNYAPTYAGLPSRTA